MIRIRKTLKYFVHNKKDFDDVYLFYIILTSWPSFRARITGSASFAFLSWEALRAWQQWQKPTHKSELRFTMKLSSSNCRKWNHIRNSLDKDTNTELDTATVRLSHIWWLMLIQYKFNSSNSHSILVIFHRRFHADSIQFYQLQVAFNTCHLSLRKHCAGYTGAGSFLIRTLVIKISELRVNMQINGPWLK